MVSRHFKLALAAVGLALLLPFICAAASTIDPDNDGSRFAYGENVGWINLAPIIGEGVTVTPSRLVGKAWGENIGWIDFSPANSGVLNDGMGQLSGYAWGENVGWINFAPTEGGVTIDPSTGIFHGRAWGENIGWISFEATASTPFKIKTAPASVTGALNGLCGSSNGRELTEPPANTSLCAVGSPSTVAGYGPWTWSCSGGNGGSDVGCSAVPQNSLLMVSLAGGGSGTVTSALPHLEINCGSVCSKAYRDGEPITLIATPAAGSRFSGWSGCDTASGSLCTVVMSGAKSVTADFSAKIKVLSTPFDSVFAAYPQVSSGNVMKLRAIDFNEEIIFARPVSYILRGGYDEAFGVQTGMSTIHGSLTISSGSVELDGIVISDSFPIPGGNGVLNSSDLSTNGVSLQMITAGSTRSLQNELQYRTYCSDTHTLSSVADMETYGTARGEYGAAAIERFSGKVGNALKFSGSDYVEAGNSPVFNFGSNSFSVEAWVNADSWVNTAGIISKGGTSEGQSGFTLRQIQSGADNYFQIVLGNGVQQVFAHAKGYVPGEWYHLIAVADRENNFLYLYVNGVLVASKSIYGFVGSTDLAANLTIGMQYQPLIGKGIFFNGLIDEAAVYNRVLSGEEVADRYNAGMGKSVEAGTGLVAGWRLDEVNGTAAIDVATGEQSGILHFAAAVSATGLIPGTSYSCNVLVKDAAGNKSAYSPANITTPILPINFSGSVIPYNFFMPTIVDVNNDGYIETLGTLNDGTGNLVTASVASMGIGKLFTPGRVSRDCRYADLNGDGLSDLICNSYSASEIYASTDPICQSQAQSYSPNSFALLFFNNGNGTFREDPLFTAKAIKGFGETILVADFNNDGFIDIYLPYYSHCTESDHSYLLLNDGVGHFTDVSDQAGVALRNRNVWLRVEGAQAVDFNLDGWIDLYAAGHMFMNNGVKNGVLTFTDKRADLGLPDVFDEGIKFLDWNNDGMLDLIIHNQTTGPALYQFNGSRFSQTGVIPSYPYQESYGLNIFDMNNDGREDIITAGGTLTSSNPTIVLLNNGAGYERSNATAMDAWGQDTISFADIDGDGKPDVLKRKLGGNGGSGLAYFRNSTTTVPNSSFKIDMVGPAGEKNQQGRLVKIYPQNHPGIIFTRIVDSGSGYMTQSSYELLVGTPYQEPHRVEAYFQNKILSFTINPGERKRIFPDGTVQTY